MSVQPYSGLETPDVAAMRLNGVFYRCYTYLDSESGDIMATLFIEQEHGQDVLLKTWQVFDGTTGGVTNSPRICAVGTDFVIVFFDTTTTDVLYKYAFDMTALHTASWVSASTKTIHADGLFDIWSLGSQMLCAFKDAAGTGTIERYASTANWTAAWSNTIADTVVNCIGVWGNTTMDLCLMGYQKSGTTQLWHQECLADGTSSSLVQTFTSAPMTTADYSAVGFCNFGGAGVAVVAEGRDENYAAAATYAANNRFVAYRLLSTTGTRSLNEHLTYNLALWSKPWSYASGNVDGTSPRVYVAAGFKSERTKHNWEQNYLFVIDLDAEKWGSAGGSVRAIPCANMTLGNADARHINILNPTTAAADDSFYPRQANHLSHSSLCNTLGPDLKTRTFACITWGRITTSDPEVGTVLSNIDTVPITAKVTGYRFHHEEPWMFHRDITDPTMPSVNHKFAYPWTQNMPIEVGRCTVLGGGTLKVYDGEALVELGFCWFPDIVAITTDATGAQIPPGVYQYTVVYEWRDAKGQIHRSAPCSPTELDTSLAGGDRIHTLVVRTQTLSLKENIRYTRQPKIDVVPYRTISGGTTFYRCFGNDSAGDQFVADTPANDPTKPWISITDNILDDDIVVNDILSWQFVNGAWAPLEPIQPPALPILCKWQNRLWGAGGEYPGVLWYSIEILPEPGGTENTAPEFNPALTYRIDSGDEQVTGMAALDNALVVFTDHNIYVMVGEPADAAGFGSTLNHQVVAQNTGCIEPRSIVVTPSGVLFQSAKGFYILTRTREIQYIGGAIEDIVRNSGNVRAASLIEDRHQVRIVLNEAPEASQRVLIYDYLFEQWSRCVWDDTIHETAGRSMYVDGTDWRGREGEVVHCVLAGTGFMVERPFGAAASYKDSDQDGTAPIVMDVRTGWIRPTPNMGGFVRFRSAIIQTDQPQDSDVYIQVDYEIRGTWDATLTDTFNAASPAPAAIRVKFSQQKCSAIRIRVYEKSIDAPETENLKLVSLTIEVGMRSGHKRVPDDQVAT